MSDKFLERFADIGVPGRRRPVNRDVQPPPEPEAWDAKPVKYMVRGVETEFFTISAVAGALGVSVQSIRAWENKGLLPKSPFRSPRPRREQLPGVTKGRRLWTREQVDAIVRIAQEEGVILNKKPPTSKFAHRVTQCFLDILNTHKQSETSP